MSKQKQEVSAEMLAELNASVPVIEGNSRTTFPRLAMLSKDISEVTGTGKNKKVKIVEAAGTFYTEQPTGKEVAGADGKLRKEYEKKFIEGETLDVIIAYHRRQLRYFDEGLKKYISSPIYDSADQVIPLFLDKRQIAKGTQKELQALYPAQTAKGKPSSGLIEEKILYVIYEGEMYQINLGRASKYSFQDYARTTNIAGVVTTIGSIEETKGSNTYRKMTFTVNRVIDIDEYNTVKEKQGILNTVVESDKQYLLTSSTRENDDQAKLDAYDKK